MQLKLKIKNTIGLLIIFLGWSISGQAQSSNLLDSPVLLNMENKSMEEVLASIEEQTVCSFFYNPDELANEKTYSFNNENLEIRTVLNRLFPNEEIKIKTRGSQIILVKNKSIKQPKVLNESFTMSGYIMDEESSETLIGATVYCAALGIGTVSNEYGFYSLTMPKGEYELTFSYVGYATKTENVILNKNLELSPLLSLGNKLAEVVVEADASTYRHSETKMSSNTISMEKIKSMPVLMGERDVLKVIQLLPGVQSGSEGTTGLYVRGGGPDQNLMLLDGIPVYNASHLLGFMSTFNGDAIKSVELIKGGFPARYGGRLSSIIDVRMKEGNMKKIKGDFTIGLISGRFNLEGPIVKDKTSFSFSGRRTWLDLFATPAQKISNRSLTATEPKNLTKYNLYDINAKINHKFSDKSRFYLSTYMGNDRLAIKFTDPTLVEDGAMDWGNRLFSARWNYQFSPKLFSNTTVYLSTYDFNFDNDLLEFAGTPNEYREIYSSNSNIRDYGAKLDFNYIPHPKHYIRTGIKYGNLDFTPTTSEAKLKEGQEPETIIQNKSPKVSGVEMNAYIEDDMVINDHIKLNAGVHIANFAVQKSNYLSLQPRVAISFLINDRSSLKFSATKMTQFLHLLASPGLGLPTDLWVSSTDKIKPENSIQYGVAYTKSLGKGFELTLEGFYKDMDNLLEYRSGYNFFSNSKDWEDKVEVGDGVSYGGEILLEKTTGKTTGWIGYTLSKSDREFPNINFGKSFPYKYDRRHDIGLVVIHKQSEKVDFGLVWVYGTGNTYTLGTTNYNGIGIDNSSPQDQAFVTLGTTNHIEGRNNQRMPAYHRLDLSVNLHKEKKRGTRTWSFGVYNAYARQNPFIITVKYNGEGVPSLKQTSLIPVLPYFSYSFKF